MRGSAHYQEAERLLSEAAEIESKLTGFEKTSVQHKQIVRILAKAQIHATLASAGATAEAMRLTDGMRWRMAA